MKNSNLFLEWFSKVSGIKRSYCKWVFNPNTKSYNLIYCAFNDPNEKRVLLYNDNYDDNFEQSVIISLVDKELCFAKLGGKKIYWRIERRYNTEDSFISCVVPKDELELELELLA
jgi:hypothetical protein